MILFWILGWIVTYVKAIKMTDGHFEDHIFVFMLTVFIWPVVLIMLIAGDKGKI